MFSTLRNILLRWRASRHIAYVNESGILVASSRVRIVCKPGSQLLLGGKLVIGFPLPNGIDRPSHGEALLYLGEGSILETKGDVYIAPGCSVMLGKNARLFFGGQNLIAHDTTLLCNVGTSLGTKSQVSWGVTIIDDDGHHFVDGRGNAVRRIRRTMRIGDRVGIQAHALIPAGIEIGDDSVVSAGVILRRDLPSGCIAYDEPKLRIRGGYFSGL